MLMLSYWGAASCVIAFESARQEIYPYKEERIVVEGLCKYTCMMGGGCGAIPVFSAHGRHLDRSFRDP